MQRAVVVRATAQSWPGPLPPPSGGARRQAFPPPKAAHVETNGLAAAQQTAALRELARAVQGSALEQQRMLEHLGDGLRLQISRLHHKVDRTTAHINSLAQVANSIKQMPKQPTTAGNDREQL